MKSDIYLRSHAKPLTSWDASDELKLICKPEGLFDIAGIGTPDDWQTAVLRSQSKRIILNCSRQIGKSTSLGCLALTEALFPDPDIVGDVLLLSRSFSQSLELMRRTREVYAGLGFPNRLTNIDEKTKIVFDNGIRIISLPENESTIRAYTARCIIIDESARVSDALYYAVRPMLSTTKGRLILASTPFGKRGFFYREWEPKTASEEWERFRMKHSDNKRQDIAFIESERKALGKELFSQEYCGEFIDFGFSIISPSDVDGAISRGSNLKIQDL